MEQRRPLAVRIAWMLAIWCASVAALGLCAWAMRLLMRAIGMGQ